jgi:hypothetical protein
MERGWRRKGLEKERCRRRRGAGAGEKQVLEKSGR